MLPLVLIAPLSIIITTLASTPYNLDSSNNVDPNTNSNSPTTTQTTVKKSTNNNRDNNWPPFIPTGPYFDTECFGRSQDLCTSGGPNCKWYTFQDPACYDRRFVSVGPAPIQKDRPIPYSVKFFSFSFGVHLVEGTFNKIFYNTNVEECAIECLKSAGDTILNLRCLSFDFYPFEVPMTEKPHDESLDRGVCMLNSETGDTARLRNEDQGFTPAELYYKSHHTSRPFSPLDGHYAVRNPRGDSLATMLEYIGPDSFSALGLQTPWGGSRWGIFHPISGLPQPITPVLECTVPSSDRPPLPTFSGGFTPVDDDQHCPGVMLKEEARKLCIMRGGDLCVDYSKATELNGRKLGCSYDNTMIWNDAIKDSGQKLFPRCCATYVMPISPVPDGGCAAFSPQRISYCSQFKAVTDCAVQGANIDRRNFYGFGRLLDTYRSTCKQISNTGGATCRHLLVSKQWEMQTDCIWCVAPGDDLNGGNGECRAGGSYGICHSARETQKQVFGVQARSVCSDVENCFLVQKYPDLVPYLTGKSPITAALESQGGEDITNKPTTTSTPPSPTNVKKTSQPTTPITSKPTNPPSPQPTKQQQQQQPSKTSAPTSTLAPTGLPCSSLTTISTCVARTPECKWSIVQNKCTTIDDSATKPVHLACSVAKTRTVCLGRDPEDGCIWVIRDSGYGACVRADDFRGQTLVTFSPTVPTTLAPVVSGCSDVTVKSSCEDKGCDWKFEGKRGWQCKAPGHD
jgi:hypothetical protein